MSTHTPGPWEFFEGASKTAAAEYDIAELWQGPPEWKANGRLIAAAPELLEALNAVRIEMKGHDRTEREEKLYRWACAAIAKAEGH